MTESELVAIHKLCRSNRESVENSDTSSCFCCLENVDKEEIEFYCDDGETVICPNCGVDAVIASSACPLSKELLLTMKNRWFGRTFALSTILA